MLGDGRLRMRMGAWRAAAGGTMAGTVRLPAGVTATTAGMGVLAFLRRCVMRGSEEERGGLDTYAWCQMC